MFILCCIEIWSAFDGVSASDGSEWPPAATTTGDTVRCSGVTHLHLDYTTGEREGGPLIETTVHDPSPPGALCPVACLGSGVAIRVNM